MMEIKNLLNMDGEIVFGIINERLRVECTSLDKLVNRYDLDEPALSAKMKALGYHYDAITNQYKADC
jgi:hypothetical protein